MWELIIHRGEKTEICRFSGKQKLSELLTEHGASCEQPCGGRGVCGKCKIELYGEVSPPNLREQALGCRLACQAEVWGNAEVYLPEAEKYHQIMVGESSEAASETPMEGRLGLAVDIGTTTLAARLYELKTAAVLAQVSGANPQRSVAADVMGRIGAALDGKQALLTDMILDALEQLLEDACLQAGLSRDEVEVLLLTGNTTMLYLLMGRNPKSLAAAPFAADHLFGEYTEVLGTKTYLPPCISAFVGADITCAVLLSGMCGKEETSLLCDIGTNGEIALWHQGKLLVTSTAAGPAFEGALISCGCGSTAGAVDRVWLERGQLRYHTICDEKPKGICGSGLIDAVAAMIEMEKVFWDGSCGQDRLTIAEGIYLLPGDIRQVQLAKAAIAAGIEVLLRKAGLRYEDVTRVYLAGGFGNYMDIGNAAAIGLIPKQWTDRITLLGNGALNGAARLMLDERACKEAEKIAGKAVHINLAGDPLFSERFVEHMFFGEEESM